MKHYTLTAEDVGKPHLRAFGQVWPVSGFLGRILPNDVGKRVYLRGGILQVENDEQHEARMSCCEFGATFIVDGSGQDIHEVWTIPNLKSPRLCQALHNHNPEDYDAMRAAPRCGCPTGCGMPARLHLFLVTAYVHWTPLHVDKATVFCEPCGDDALESGRYCAGEDLLEPHHGPGCIERMMNDDGPAEYCDRCNSKDNVRPEPPESTYFNLCAACKKRNINQW